MIQNLILWGHYKLEMELIDIKGVGKTTIAKLESLGINTPQDVIEFLPKTYLDMSCLSVLSDAVSGQYVLLSGKVNKVSNTTRLKGVQFFKCNFDSQNNEIKLVWYNASYLRQNLVDGGNYFVYGKIHVKNNQYTMYNPSFEYGEKRERLLGILAIYQLKGIVGKALYSKIVKQCLQNCSVVGLIDKELDISLMSAYNMAHLPNTLQEIEIAKKRINKEIVVSQIVAHKLSRNSVTFTKTTIYGQNGCIIKDLQKTLSYELSFSQQEAVDQIIKDLRDLKPMNRMLLGDVGSGKTIVALLTLYYTAMCNHQGAMLAPTAILAKQHYDLAQKLFKNFKISICLLLGETSKNDREKLKYAIKNHQIDIVFGTHALFNEDIIFDDLTYIVVDELHKFGVKQKGILLNKADNVDALIMSATPIPRVVALTVYGDISQSVLASRKFDCNIKTHIINDEKLDGLFSFISKRIAIGEQAYIVCPLVEDSDGLEIFSAKSTYEQLQKDYPTIKFGLVYGKQNDKQKQEVMHDFMSAKVQVLVATSVIEVGIDCQNASVIAVLNSDRFGLASLHQLRGRIGRNPNMEGFCFLHTSSVNENLRLKIMQDYFDGNAIAEEDAKIRGYGDFLGISQSGGKTDLLLTKDFVAECNTLAQNILLKNPSQLVDNPMINKYIEKLRNIEMM